MADRVAADGPSAPATEPSEQVSEQVPAVDSSAAPAADTAGVVATSEAAAGDAAVSGEGATTDVEEVVKAETAVVEKPKGRKNKLVSPESEVEVTLWQAFVGALVTLIIIIDDEWIWIPGAIYGCLFWVYKRAEKLALHVADISPRHIGAAAVASALSTVAAPALAVAVSPMVGHGLTSVARSMMTSPGGLLAPATWGLRMGIFTKALRVYIEETHEADTSLWQRTWMTMKAAGMAESTARLTTAPFVKMVDQCRKSPGTPAWTVARELMRSKGVFALWEGMAPLRIEVPHMMLMLSTWATLRTAATSYLPKWDTPGQSTTTRMLERLPIDAASGAVASVVSYTATQKWRLSVDAAAREVTSLTRGSSQVACAQVVNHSAIPLVETLALRTPQAAVTFALYGAAMNYVDSDLAEVGLTGWGDAGDLGLETQYGGTSRKHSKYQDSFWEFFGARMSRAPDYSKRSSDSDK
eukprot:Rhum_TRINITY_DN8560_c0_g1::Rhum_TRINITY_DN8560_c0_g1_i1::g.28701::m.28701